MANLRTFSRNLQTSVKRWLLALMAIPDHDTTQCLIFTWMFHHECFPSELKSEQRLVAANKISFFAPPEEHHLPGKRSSPRRNVERDLDSSCSKLSTLPARRLWSLVPTVFVDIVAKLPSSQRGLHSTQHQLRILRGNVRHVTSTWKLADFWLERCKLEFAESTLTFPIDSQTGRPGAKFAITAAAPFTRSEIKHRGTPKCVFRYVAQHFPDKLLQSWRNLPHNEQLASRKVFFTAFSSAACSIPLSFEVSSFASVHVFLATLQDFVLRCSLSDLLP